LTNNIEGIVGGAVASVVCDIQGWIDTDNFLQAATVAFVGGVIGYLTNKLMKLIEKKIKLWLKR
jgi:predicted CDP-diglyceride synthetase/phosphatidate cytidylyltransferase